MSPAQQPESTGRHGAADAHRKAASRLIPFLMLLYFFAFLDRVNIGFAALTMNADLGLSATAYGFGAGIFFVGYVLFEVPSNLLLERFGARRWIARIMITWGLLSAATALAQGPISFYVIRFLLGVAEAGFFPGIILYLTYWFPSPTRAQIVGAFMMALPVSSVIGAPVSTALLSLDALGLSGWQWLFIIEGLPTVALGAVVFKYLPDRPADASWLSPAERQSLTDIVSADRRTIDSVHRYSATAALTSGGLWMLGLIYLGIVSGVYGFAVWLPQIINGLGDLSFFEVGVMTTIPYAASAVAMYSWGRHSDKTGERIWHVAIPALCGGFALAAAASLGQWPLVSLAVLTVSAIGVYCALPTFWTLPTSMLTGAGAAAGIALINSIGNVGGFVGPALVGYFKDSTGEYATGLLALASVCVVSAGLTLCLPRGRAGLQPFDRLDL